MVRNISSSQAVPLNSRGKSSMRISNLCTSDLPQQLQTPKSPQTPITSSTTIGSPVTANSSSLDNDEEMHTLDMTSMPLGLHNNLASCTSTNQLLTPSSARYSNSQSTGDQGYAHASSQQRDDKIDFNGSRVLPDRSAESRPMLQRSYSSTESDQVSTNLGRVDSRKSGANSVRSSNDTKESPELRHQKTEKGRRDDTTDLIKEQEGTMPLHFLDDIIPELSLSLPEFYLGNITSVSKNQKPAKNSVLEQVVLYMLALKEERDELHEVKFQHDELKSSLAEFYPDAYNHLCSEKSGQGKASALGSDSMENRLQERRKMVLRVVKIAKFRAQHGQPTEPGPDNKYRQVKSTLRSSQENVDGTSQ